MRTGRWLTSLLRKREPTKEKRHAAETLRMERQTARLQNRHSAIQAETQQHTRSGFGSPG
jgi:hypothetical protein